MTGAVDRSDLKGARVLVTGATGATGSVLAHQLHELGAEVVAACRSTSSKKRLAGLPVEWREADLRDPETVPPLTEGVDYVFHVAAGFREAKLATDAYRKINVESTLALARSVAGRPGFRRFVHVSTNGVHGHIRNPPADETHPFNPGDVYQRAKLEAETALWKLREETGLGLSVVRPVAIFGPPDTRLLRLFRWAKKKRYPLLGRGRCLLHLVHTQDLAEFMTLLAVHPAAEGEAFLCGAPESTSVEEIVSTVSRSLDLPLPRAFRLPVWPFWIAAVVCEGICVPLGLEPPIFRRRVAFFTKDRSFSIAKAKGLLRWEARRSGEQGLAETAAWYQEQGLL